MDMLHEKCKMFARRSSILEDESGYDDESDESSDDDYPFEYWNNFKCKVDGINFFRMDRMGETKNNIQKRKRKSRPNKSVIKRKEKLKEKFESTKIKPCQNFFLKQKEGILGFTVCPGVL